MNAEAEQSKRPLAKERVFLRYSPNVEHIGEGEDETFSKIVDTFKTMGEAVRANEGRAVRVSHAKSTGLLTGTLTIDEELPEELAQGIAASPRSFEALIRLAQGPGEILSDRISVHRGMAVKILDVPGERLSVATEQATQDFVLEAGKPSFINSNASMFLANLKAGVANAPHLPDGVKSAVSSLSRATNAPLEAFGAGSKVLAFFGHPRLHPLAECYFSQAPLRWGAYVGKLGFFPDQALLGRLATREIENSDDDAFRNAVVDHFVGSGASFELRVQLATTEDETPIEDATTEWPEQKTPYRRVGQLSIPPQNAWSPNRARYFDERLSFKPANSLSSHRPLGQIMRARLFAYDRLRQWRQNTNGVAPVEPRTLAEVPA